MRLAKLTLVILAASFLYSCGAGDQAAVPAAPAVNQGQNGFQNFSLNLGPFGGANRADLVVVNTQANGADLTL
ncbi:MAG: hypothetical protein AB1758_18885, partial [Candidatus Eremiobacterota bacterium]